MKRLFATQLALFAALLAFAAPASADFGFTEAGVGFNTQGGTAETQAGAHPYSVVTSFGFHTKLDPELGIEVPDGEARNLRVGQIAGLVGDSNAVPRCSDEDFFTRNCPAASQVGWNDADIGIPFSDDRAPVYSLNPPPGAVLRLGFLAVNLVPVTIDIGLSQTYPYEVVADLQNIPNVVPFKDSAFTLWGVPADEAHNAERFGTGTVSNFAPKPFLVMPRACTGPLTTHFEAESWQGAFDQIDATTHVGAEPRGMSGCEKLGLEPTITAKPSTKAAASGSGLDFELSLQDEGLKNPSALAASDLRKTVVTLPEGFTANPSLAEGLAVCSEAQLAKETATSLPGEGCPQASKIGNVEVESPLLEGNLLKGSLFMAKPYENPFGSLLALYMTVKDPQLGIGVRLAGKIEPDPKTGQLVTTFGDPTSSNPEYRDLPQLPFSHFRLQFREGARSPLISPPHCGSFDVKAQLTPWSGTADVQSTSTFQIISGPNASACPGEQAPFKPGFQAGSIDNHAASYSPFTMRLTRGDGEQDMTKFSATLPPGVTGKIAGLSRCSDADIAKAASRTGPNGAQEEIDDPSCPASSKIGRTSAGAGVGSELTYVGGSLYLAGPYKGDPLSVVAITPAKAGPFDAGVIVVREALTLNPVTAQVQVDGSASDPIPHILKGIPLNVRDLRVYTDRPDFTLNPTNCSQEQTDATLWGGGTTFIAALETPTALSDRYQAADCAALPFKPKLKLKLTGGTKRGRFPALRATVTTRGGEANFKGAVVTLPRSAFLEQAHIRTICTRVQFAAGAGNGAQCPPASIYGKARAWTPLLDEPAEGPVYMRSSSHKLPDLVVALKGPPSAPFNVEVDSRIDSHKGGIRSSFESVPDLPVSKFLLEMQGGKKGLIVNSRNLCFKPKRNRANARLSGQNGRIDRSTTPMKARCGGKGHKKRRHR
jgi:hypothetical protein